MVLLRCVACVFILVFLTVRATGQDASLLPGLHLELAAAKDDTLRADALARICFNLIRSDPDSARLVGDQALALAKRIKQPRALGDAHNNLGWLAAEQGQFDRADSLLSIALGIFQKLGVPQYTSVTLSNLGWLAEKRGDSVSSLKRFQEALALSEQAKDTASASILLYSLGVAYRKIKDYAQSAEHLRRSMALEQTLGRAGKEANCAVGLANTLKEQGDTTAARSAYEQAIAAYRRIQDHHGWGIAEENLGDLELANGPRAALVHFSAALAHYDTIHSAIDKAYVLQRIGSAYVAMGDLKNGESSLREGLALSSGAGDPQLVLDYERGLAKLYAKMGDGDAAIAHFERHLFLKDSLQGADTQRELARLRTEFETERKEKDNALLRAENGVQAARIRSGQVKLYASIAVALLVLMAALLLLRNFLQKRKHANALENLNKQLENSNAEITEINGLLEMKLLRSQMNPHFIYNCLNSAARMTQAGHSVEALAYLQGFARLLRMVLDHSVDDRVALADEIDFLRQYLKLEAHRLEGLHFAVEADRELLDDEVELPALLVQPFVENAVWHGLAEKEGDKSISVRFAANGEGFRCVIEDNGVGRDRSGTKPVTDGGHRSLGMQLTSERLRLLARRMSEGGHIQVEDLKDTEGHAAGTRVTLLLH